MKNHIVPLFILFFIPRMVHAQEFPVMQESARLQMLIPPKEKVHAILDTDTFNEIDDQFALVYALLSGNKIDLQAVYAAPFFNDRSSSPGDGMEKSYQEIVKILGMMNKPADNFAFRGSAGFLKDLKSPYKSLAALDLISKANKSTAENPLYVIATGAITNVASALLVDPSIINKIVVVWLGGNGRSWPDTHEFNLAGDLLASQLIFDCGVPLVQVPCTPVVTHFATTIPEMEKYVKGNGKIGDYLFNIFKTYDTGEEKGWSKVIWDMTAVAYVVNPDWTPSSLVHSPILTDQFTYSFSDNRHFIRYVYYINRDPIFRDFFDKLEHYASK